MISFLEVVKRALTGPLCTEREFDLKIFNSKLNEVVEEYGIKYDPENPVPSDDTLADEVFDAALKFYSEIGTYCLDTHRIIRFDEGEIKEAIRYAKNSVKLGEGKEEKEFLSRKPDSSIPPWCSVGGCGVFLSSEELFLRLTEALGSIPLADSISTNCLIEVEGQKILPKSPLEVIGAIRTVLLAKEALRRAGRPGLPIVNGAATAISDVGKISGGAFTLQKSDAYEVCSIAEMKVDFGMLNEVAYALNSGNKIIAACGPLLGGYCGGPEGLAVATTAYTFQGLLVQKGDVQHPYPVHYRYITNSGRELLWANSLSYQAISRNVEIPLLCIPYAAAGPATEMIFYEIASDVSSIISSGGSIEAVGLRGTEVDYSCHLEPLFATEVAKAVTGMTRESVNEIVKELLPKYEERIPKPPKGKRFQECYKKGTIEPTAEYLRLYKRVRKEISEYGIPLE